MPPRFQTGEDDYIPEVGNWVRIRRQLSYMNVDLFFGFSLPAICTLAHHLRVWQAAS